VLARVLIAAVRFYQLAISPWMPAACRYTPTCSAYAIEALREHGAVRGLWLTARRLGRCHPWGGCGHDPVPTPPPDRRTRRRSPERDVASLARTPILTK